MSKYEKTTELNEQHLTLIRTTLQQYCKEKGVTLINATILGSYFLGTNNQYSDIDVYAVILYPKEYYLKGRDIINTETVNNIEIPGLPTEIDIQYRDFLYYVKEFKRSNPTAIDCFLSGIKLHTDEKIITLLKKVLNPRTYLDNLINSIHRNKRDITIYNIKEVCRIIRDITRVRQLLQSNEYFDKPILDIVKDYDEKLHAICIKRKEKDPILTQDEIDYVYQVIEDVTVAANKTYTGSFIIKENEELDNYILSLFKE